MPETAYLYDAVHLYERSLLKALDEDRDPRNGRELVATLYGVHYRSAMGYVYRPFPPLPLCKSEKKHAERDVANIGRFSTKTETTAIRHPSSIFERKSRGSMIKRRVDFQCKNKN